LSTPICYDVLNNPVHVGDPVLVANRGELTKALVVSITKPKHTVSRPKPTMTIVWQDNPDGMHRGYHWKPCEGKLKLSSCQWKPDGLLKVNRICRIESI